MAEVSQPVVTQNDATSAGESASVDSALSNDVLRAAGKMLVTEEKLDESCQLKTGKSRSNFCRR